jgi:hypothetical protein
MHVEADRIVTSSHALTQEIHRSVVTKPEGAPPA